MADEPGRISGKKRWGNGKQAASSTDRRQPRRVVGTACLKLSLAWTLPLVRMFLLILTWLFAAPIRL